MVDSCQSSTAKRSSPSPSSSCAPPPKRPRAEAPASPTASVPGRTEEDSAAAAAARSTGSAEDAAAKKDQVGDKPAVAAADSSRRRKEQQQQQQQAAPLGKLVSQRSQLLPLTKREERLKEEICAEFRGRLKEEIYAEVLGRLKEVIRGQIASLNERMNEKMNQIFNQLQAIPVILGASPPQCRSSCASNDIKSVLREGRQCGCAPLSERLEKEPSVKAIQGSCRHDKGTCRRTAECHERHTARKRARSVGSGRRARTQSRNSDHRDLCKLVGSQCFFVCNSSSLSVTDLWST